MISDSGADWRQQAEQEYQQRRKDILDDMRDVQRQIDAAQKRLAEIQRALADLDHAARTFGIPAPQQIELGRQVGLIAAEGRLFKDVVLDILREAYPKSMKAREIQAIAETRFAKSVHPKTTGMTLYRLARDRSVRRKGHKWFYVPEKPEGPEKSEPSANE